MSLSTHFRKHLSVREACLAGRRGQGGHGVTERLISAVLYGYYVLLLKTCRFTAVGWENVDEGLRAGLGVVLATTHRVLLPCIQFVDGRPGTFLASKSKDGELIARLLERRGFTTIRGSSSRGGTAALEAMLLAVRQGRVVGVTFDGPRGPPCVPKPGVGLLAWEARNACWFGHARILPRTVFPGLRFPFALRLRSWDRFLLPLPFCRIAITFERIEVAAPHGERRAWIDEFLERLEARAREVYADVYVGAAATENQSYPS